MKIDTLLLKLDGVKQTRYGQPDWMARCPAHRDKNPSLHISLGRDGEILLNCFAGCETERVVAALGIEMADLFQDESGPRVYLPRYPKVEYPEPKPVDELPHGLSTEAINFLRGRDLDPELAESLGITSSPDGHRAALYFPYYRDGELVNRKTRYLPKGFRMEEGCELIFFGLDDAIAHVDSADTSTLVIVEGELDWLTIKQVGGYAVMSVPNGAGGKNLSYFENDITAKLLLERPGKDIREVVIATDADEPGQILAQALIDRIGREKCSLVAWPAGCNDANETLMRLGPKEVRAAIEGATPQSVPEGVYDPLSHQNQFEHLYRHGLPRGVSTGFRTLDMYYSILPRYLTLVSGVPGSGKSEFLDNIMVNMAIQQDWRFVVYSPENMPIEEYLSRWAEKYMRKPFFAGPTPRMTPEEAHRSLEWAQRHIRIVDPETPSSDTIMKLFDWEVLRWGANAWVIDPFNEIDDGERSDGRDDKYLSRVIRQYRKFCVDRNVHGFIVNHPHAMRKDTDGNYPPVDLYDLHGGSMWSNKISGLLSVWRDHVNADSPVKVYVKKAKTRRVGRKGRVDFRYNIVDGTYIETGTHESGG